VASAVVPGDVNGDGMVDLEDFEVISDHFRLSVPQLTDGDLDGDGFVGSRDFRIWTSAHRGQPASSVASSNAVLEPSALGIVLPLLIGVTLSSTARRSRLAYATQLHHKR
jgi:hypothetical protein